jgi:uncharacterized protein (DUF1778 family)
MAVFKTQVVRARVTAREFKLIHAAAAAADLTLSEYLRGCVTTMAAWQLADGSKKKTAGQLSLEFVTFMQEQSPKGKRRAA